MRFVDLFAGLGGFHVALAGLGHECVFASEIDPALRQLYARNFNLEPHGDIRAISPSRVPDHDVLCAGSPCQPFSKAGEQQGRDCPRWGDLLDHVIRIARAKTPRYLILENVPNLYRHNGGDTWRALEKEFSRAGYTISSAFLSPHQFGVPQIRERLFIVGSRTGLSRFSWPRPEDAGPLTLTSVLDTKPSEARALPRHVVKCLDVWQSFLRRFPKNNELPWFPIWTTEFGATYPYEETTPWAQSDRQLRRFCGSHGIPLAELPAADRLLCLPSYAQSEEKEFPGWKKSFIRLNREFYAQHRSWIDKWLPQIIPFPASLQKFEWHCKGEERDIWKYVIQFRASGVRVKRPTTAPSLIAMTTTQVPIIAWERRYMTPRECSRLQSLDGLQFLPNNPTRAFKALGNAVNSNVVALIASALLQPATEMARSPLARYSRKNAQPIAYAALNASA